MNGKTVVFNPQNLPVEKLPSIIGFNNGGSFKMLEAVLIAEDGTYLGGYCCSHEYYMPMDLGILEECRPDRHITFQEHYPNGYQMEFVTYKDVKKHSKLQEAFKLHNKV